MLWFFLCNLADEKRNLFHLRQKPWFDEKWPTNAKHQMAPFSSAPIRAALPRAKSRGIELARAARRRARPLIFGY
jgi:hypothetical protein